MTEQIILDITPADDGVRCGECRGLDGELDNTWICPYATEVERDDTVYCIRGPLCLAAEARFRALVEAGEGLKETPIDDMAWWPTRVKLWDRAVKEAGE